MKKAFKLLGVGKSKIETKVYERPPKNCPNFDIIRLKVIHEKGEKLIDCFVYPEEAMLIASALMRAWILAYSLNKHELKPK